EWSSSWHHLLLVMGQFSLPPVVVTAPVALAAVPGVRIVVPGGSSAAGETRRAGGSGCLPVVHRRLRGRRRLRRPRCRRDGCGRRLSSRASGNGQRERAGSEDALRLRLRHGFVSSSPVSRSAPPVRFEPAQYMLFSL